MTMYATKQLFIFAMKSIAQWWWKRDRCPPTTNSLIIFSILYSVGKFAWQQQKHQHCSRFTVAIMRLNGKWKFTMNAHDSECIFYPVHIFSVKCSWLMIPALSYPRIRSRCSTHSWKYMKMINLPYIRNTNVSRFCINAKNTSSQQLRYESQHFQQTSTSWDAYFGNCCFHVICFKRGKRKCETKNVNRDRAGGQTMSK